MLGTLQNWDRWLFTRINHDWTNSFFDSIFPLWRESKTWIPLYLFLLVFLLLNFGRKAWPWIIGLIVTVILTDQVSSSIIKPLVGRPRPCHDTLLADHIRLLLNNCSNHPSFTSSHATNHFGLAFFIWNTLKQHIGKWGYLFFFWAASISYGQVYIGVHYPVDVICGGLLGTGIGYLTSRLFNKKFGLPSFVHETNRMVSG
jgi:membrane-associated phospholipid phosphatase